MGTALANLGFKELTGVDLIPKMVEKAKGLGVYKTLRQADLMAKMEFPDESFDCLVSVGVTTYLGKWQGENNFTRGL